MISKKKALEIMKNETIRKQQYSMTLPPNIVEKLRMRATEEGRTLSNYVTKILTTHLSKMEENG